MLPFAILFFGWGQVRQRLNFLITFVRWDKDVAVKSQKIKLTMQKALSLYAILVDS